MVQYDVLDNMSPGHNIRCTSQYNLQSLHAYGWMLDAEARVQPLRFGPKACIAHHLRVTKCCISKHTHLDGHDVQSVLLCKAQCHANTLIQHQRQYLRNASRAAINSVTSNNCTVLLIADDAKHWATIMHHKLCLVHLHQRSFIRCMQPGCRQSSAPYL